MRACFGKALALSSYLLPAACDCVGLPAAPRRPLPPLSPRSSWSLNSPLRLSPSLAAFQQSQRGNGSCRLVYRFFSPISPPFVFSEVGLLISPPFVFSEVGLLRNVEELCSAMSQDSRNPTPTVPGTKYWPARSIRNWPTGYNRHVQWQV